MGAPPIISIVTPVYDTDPDVLRECLESVAAQTYRFWQHCLVDDASSSPHVWPLLERALVDEPRVRIHRRESNGGIVAASNDAIAMATGDIVVLLDHDDLLAPQALERVAEVFRSNPEVDYVYTDEDVIDASGRRCSPFFKPDWSPERFRTQMYTCHLSAIRRTLLDRIGWFRDGFDGSQDWDLVLRVTEQARRIVHIPEVLYHWRTVPTSVLAGEHVKPYAYEAAARVLADHCERVGIDADVVELERRGHFRIARRIGHQPRVSIVIPTRGSSGRVWGVERTMVVEAIRSIVVRSTWTNLEFVVVADVATPPETIVELREIAGDRLRVVEWSSPFDFAAVSNLGASVASGDLLLFLNADVEVITPDWLEVLAGFLLESDVGASGCHLLFEDGRLQHAGHALIGGNPGHLMFGQDPNRLVNRLVLRLDREVSGVTGACLMMRRDVWDEVGGFSPLFHNNYNDVDLCAKVRFCGYRVVVSPHAQLYHFESMTRDPAVTTEELDLLRRRWRSDLWRDPYYSASHRPALDSYPEPVPYP